jgi:hypothetical protein
MRCACALRARLNFFQVPRDTVASLRDDARRLTAEDPHNRRAIRALQSRVRANEEAGMAQLVAMGFLVLSELCMESRTYKSIKVKRNKKVDVLN